jgi:hypothetical protein
MVFMEILVQRIRYLICHLICDLRFFSEIHICLSCGFNDRDIADCDRLRIMICHLICDPRNFSVKICNP